MATITGTPGSDTLVGTPSNDVIDGLGGDDLLYGLAGADLLSGGDNNDQLEGGLGADSLDGSIGFDYARYRYAAGSVVVDLVNAGANTGEAQGDTFVSIEGLIGSNFDDQLFGDAVANDIAGLAGNDTLLGRGGADNLQGMDGDDELEGGAGADVLKGGAGFDFASYRNASGAVLAILAGSGNNTGDAAGDFYLAIEGVIGSAFGDTLAGDNAANVLQGLDGDDYLQARAGIDSLQGGNGNDQLEGGADADVLDGGVGFDYARYRYATGAVTVDLAAPGSNTGEALGDSYTSIEGLIGTMLNDRLYGDGGSSDFAGLDGNDVINGRGGDDNLQGMAGDDALNGGAGADQIAGGAGNDTFTFKRGEAAGDKLLDFDGNGAGAGDQLRFKGYGTAADGATFTPDDATHWRIHASDGFEEVITLDNGAPVDPSDVVFIGALQVSVPENTTAVMTVTANDVDVGPSRTFSITGGADQAQFTIDAMTGVLAFATTPDFEAPADSDANNVYDVEVTITDGVGLTDVQAIVVTVSNVDDTVELSTIAAGTGGFVINGRLTDDLSGYSVASAGDVNGDGLSDLIVGAVLSDPAAGSRAGRSYVVFGQTGTVAVDLSAVAAGGSNAGGFVIDGQGSYDESGFSVAGAGDVNGDGLSDVIVGAYGSNPVAGSDAGRSYVVFGRTGTASVDLSAVATGGLNAGGFVINGQCANDFSGISVASAGDVNGDGLSDLIVGAARSDPIAGSYAGRSYVVFGHTGTAGVDLSAIEAGNGGFVINGQCAADFSGSSVASAGDVNGDGLSDLIVGAYRSDPAAGNSAGRSYVVFGQTGTAPVDLSAVAAGGLNAGGFVINGQGGYDYSGFSVASAGDVNGDGLSDLIVGAQWSHPAAGFLAGRSYVVFGQTGTAAVDLSAVAAGGLNAGGFVINGQCSLDFSGRSVASAGDVNGDGLSDLIVGAPRSDSTAGSDAGRSYVVFGQTGTAAVDLSAIAAGELSAGFVINGQCAGDISGFSVAAAGDVNGDGLSDLIVGAHLSDPNNVSAAGRSYVIFGSTAGVFATTAVDQLGTGGNNSLTGSTASETLVGGAGDDTLTGNGGADVLYGGSGSDTFVLDSSNVAALSASFGAGGNLGQLARVDGGTGIDTLQLSGTGVALDLGLVANQGASGPSSASRIEAVERIDLTGSGNNTLALTVNDVVDMSGMNGFNNANGWADGTYDLAAGGANGANPEQRHQVVIDGNAGDTVNSSGWGASVGTVTNAGQTYNVYNAGLYAQLLIDTDVTASVI